jgi:hypothetical protein
VLEGDRFIASDAAVMAMALARPSVSSVGFHHPGYAKNKLCRRSQKNLIPFFRLAYRRRQQLWSRRRDNARGAASNTGAGSPPWQIRVLQGDFCNLSSALNSTRRSNPIDRDRGALNVTRFL